MPLRPAAGMFDYDTSIFQYILGKFIVEWESVKMYLWRFREERHFREDVKNRIYFVDKAGPRRPEIVGRSNVLDVICTTSRT